MPDKTKIAQTIIIEIQSLSEGDYTNRTNDMLRLINEILKDSKALARVVIEEEYDKVS